MFAERDNGIELVEPPLSDRFGSLGNQISERRNPEASSDGDATNSVGDINEASPDFDVRRLFQQDRRVEVLTGHLSVPRIHKPIRRADDGRTDVNFKQLKSLVKSPPGNRSLGPSGCPAQGASALDIGPTEGGRVMALDG
jgi:hypothetical protein